MQQASCGVAMGEYGIEVKLLIFVPADSVADAKEQVKILAEHTRKRRVSLAGCQVYIEEQNKPRCFSKESWDGT